MFVFTDPLMPMLLQLYKDPKEHRWTKHQHSQFKDTAIKRYGAVGTGDLQANAWCAICHDFYPKG
jgi:hypothetical protein